MFRRPFSAIDGAIRVRLGDDIQQVLVSLLGQLREALLVDSGAELRRLYPTAYPDDAELESEYQQLVHDQLLMSRLDGIDTMEATLVNEVITPDEADIWMNTINQLRLVLGTRLNVSEADHEPIDTDDPEATSLLIYQLLSQLLEALTHARTELL